jgi:hypothetical protein
MAGCTYILWRSVTPCASPPPWPSIFSNYYFHVYHPVTGMTGISLHMQWPPTSQSHGRFVKENNCVFSLRIKLLSDQESNAQFKYFDFFSTTVLNGGFFSFGDVGESTMWQSESGEWVDNNSFPRLLFRRLDAGRPDWENFRTMGDCLLWAVTWKWLK